jgi:hypothetical protein
MKFYKSREEMYKRFCIGRIGAEVGVQKGDNAKSLLDAGTLELALIDSWKHVADDDYARDPANIPQRDHDWLFGVVLERFQAETDAGRVRIHRLTSLEAAPLYGDWSLDFLFLDAMHTYEAVWADLCAWEHAINETGVILIHDFVCTPEAERMGFGVFEATIRFMEEKKWKPVGLSKEGWDTLAITRK